MAVEREDEAAVGLEGEWTVLAACRGEVGVFFPPLQFERKEIRFQRERAAKAICRACAVRAECLSHAVRHGEAHGIWGGLTEDERATLQDEDPAERRRRRRR